MANREEIKEEVATNFYDKKASVTPGTALALFFIAVYLTITYPFWLVREKIRRNYNKEKL